MDSLTTGCQVPGTASPFPSLRWEDAAGASQTPAPVLHREGLFVGPLPTDNRQHVEPGEWHTTSLYCMVFPVVLQSYTLYQKEMLQYNTCHCTCTDLCVTCSSQALFSVGLVLSYHGSTAPPGASVVRDKTHGRNLMAMLLASGFLATQFAFKVTFFLKQKGACVSWICRTCGVYGSSFSV